jgi:hypothetical protein
VAQRVINTMAAHVAANATKMPKPAPHAFSHLDLPWTAERDGLVERVKGLEQVRTAVAVAAAARGCVDGNGTRAREGERERAAMWRALAVRLTLGREGVVVGYFVSPTGIAAVSRDETPWCVTADAGVGCDRTRRRWRCALRTRPRAACA